MSQTMLVNDSLLNNVPCICDEVPQSQNALQILRLAVPDVISPFLCDISPSTLLNHLTADFANLQSPH